MVIEHTGNCGKDCETIMLFNHFYFDVTPSKLIRSTWWAFIKFLASSKSVMASITWASNVLIYATDKLSEFILFIGILSVLYFTWIKNM